MKRRREEDGMNAVNVGQVVFPGDIVASDADKKLVAGEGLLHTGVEVVSTRCGVLQKASHKQIWIDNAQRRYIPALEDNVLGVVTGRHGENFAVDIGAPFRATLPSLAFDGATKRNKPNLQVGTLVYARVVLANKDMEPELNCTSPLGKEWMTSQAIFGMLKGGYVIECDLKYARKLLEDDCFVLQCIGRAVPYEVAIGHNGRVWVNSANPLNITRISNCILLARTMTKQQVEQMVKAVFTKH